MGVEVNSDSESDDPASCDLPAEETNVRSSKGKGIDLGDIEFSVDDLFFQDGTRTLLMVMVAVRARYIFWILTSSLRVYPRFSILLRSWTNWEGPM